jgi:hypothetical protein
MELVHKIEWEENGAQQSLVIDEPIGYDSLVVTLERHDFHGIGAEASLGDLEFYGKAAEIINRLYEADIDNEIYYEVSEPVGQKWLLDLSTYKKVEGNYTSIACKVCETGQKTIFNNRTEIDIDLHSTNSIDGKDINGAQWQTIGIPTKHLLYTNISKRNVDSTYTGNSTEGIYIGHNVNFLALPIGNNINAEFGELKETEIEYTTDTSKYIEAQYTPDTEHEAKYGTGTKARVQIELRGQITVMSTILNYGNEFAIQLVAEDALGGIVEGNKQTITKDAIFAPGATISLDLKLYGILSADSSIRHYLQFTFANGDSIKAYISVLKGSFVKIRMYDNIKEESTSTSAIMVYDALSLVTRAISEGEMNVVSDWYTYQGKPGGGALKCLTNGYKIRGLYIDSENKRNMPLSFKSLITNLNALDCVGWGFHDNTVRVERWNWFYQNNLLLDIQEANEITTEVNTSQLITELTIGYKKYATTSQYNSIDSPHGVRVFASNNKVAHESATKECEFIADNYAIEETRRSRSLVSETEETTYDENIFVIELVKEIDARGERFLVRTTAVDAEDIERPEEFINAKLTPRQMATRWKDYIFQSTSKSELRFMSGEINYQAEFDVIPEERVEYGMTIYSLKNFASGMLKENEDIANEKSLLRAESISLTYPITLEEYKAIKANPYGMVRVKGNDCWIKSFRYSFADGEAEFKLIPKAN